MNKKRKEKQIERLVTLSCDTPCINNDCELLLKSIKKKKKKHKKKHKKKSKNGDDDKKKFSKKLTNITNEKEKTKKRKHSKKVTITTIIKQRPQVQYKRLSDLSANRRNQKHRRRCAVIIVPGVASGMITNNRENNRVHKKQKVVSFFNSSSARTKTYDGNTDRSCRSGLLVREIKCSNMIPESGLIARHRRFRLQSLKLKNPMIGTNIEPELVSRIMSSLSAEGIVITKQRTVTSSVQNSTSGGSSNSTIVDDTVVDEDENELPLNAPVEQAQPRKKKQRKLDSDYSKAANEKWEQMFRLLLEYKKFNNGSTLVPQPLYKEFNDGSTLVPQIFDVNRELGSWVHHQRTYNNEEELSKGRTDRLDDIGFVWKVNIFVPWIEMYQRLVDYEAQYGTTMVPTKYNDDPALGYWVRNQRNKCKKKDRIQLLKNINFVWDTRFRKKEKRSKTEGR